ncbi:hypothetical protein MHU86_7708 [Fragilaria crotonensis]|nr:hypothetical protein MHU86_7708 [Fragilaria crotonensis]
MEESTAELATPLDKENCPPQEKGTAGGKKKAASFPEGESYELLLMEIVDRTNAHIPPKGSIGQYWTKVVAEFNATSGSNIDKLNDWRPIRRKYICIRSNAEAFQKSVAAGIGNEDDLSETMSKAYGIAYDHALDENEAKKVEDAAKLKLDRDAANQVEEGRALRQKSATRIIGGEIIQVGGPKMVLGGNGEVVELESDDDSAAGRIVVTPAAKKLKRTHSASDGGACNTTLSTNKALCHDLLASLTQTRQGNVEIEAKRLDFEKQLAEKKQTMDCQRLELEKLKMELDGEERRQRIEMEKEENMRKHELQMQSMELQKMQMEASLAELKIRLAQLERAAKESK